MFAMFLMINKQLKVALFPEYIRMLLQIIIKDLNNKYFVLIFKAIKDAEADLEIAKLHAIQAREALEQAKLKLREQQHDGLTFFVHYIS